MLKIFFLFGLFMGFYCERKYKCIKYTGKLADMTDKTEQCEGSRCWRVQFVGTPETVALDCLTIEESFSNMKWQRLRINKMFPNSVFSAATNEDLKITVCAGDLCNKDANSVNDFSSTCDGSSSTSLKYWRDVGYQDCLGERCFKAEIDENILLGCTDDLGCSEERMKDLKTKVIGEYKSLTGFVAIEEDVKTICCKGDHCNHVALNVVKDTTCYDFSKTLADMQKTVPEGRPNCKGGVCPYSVGGDRVLMECANAVECKAQNFEKVKEDVFKKLSKNNPTLTAANDVKTSCCATNWCNYADKPAAETFAVTCYNYAGLTSEINLKTTCLGERCVTFHYDDRTELSCYPKMFCETDKIKETKEERLKHLKLRGIPLTVDDIDVTCCSEDKCNNAAHLLPLKDESVDAHTAAHAAPSFFLTFVLFLFLTLIVLPFY